jgi:hypothetical protein
MASTPPPLWDSYDDDGEGKLVELLNAKLGAAQDRQDDTVDEAVTRSLASAIARHEDIKAQLDAPNQYPTLREHAQDISTADISSWRPKSWRP